MKINDNIINESNVIINPNIIYIINDNKAIIYIKYGKYKNGFYSGYSVSIYGNDFHLSSCPVIVSDKFKYLSENDAINAAIDDVLIYLRLHNDKKYVSIVQEYLNSKKQLTLF